MEAMILRHNILYPISTGVKDDVEHKFRRRPRLHSQQVR